MITARQCRAGRGLIGWTQEALSKKAEVAIMAVKRFETGSVATRDKTVEAIESALVGGGVTFLPATDDRGEGVCLQTSSTDR